MHFAFRYHLKDCLKRLYTGKYRCKPRPGFLFCVFFPKNYGSKDLNLPNKDGKVEIDLAEFPLENIRNFSVIAHIDHGKSTFADRILELTGAIVKEDSNRQVLDRLQVEKERGITVKAQSASVVFTHNDQKFLLNLIDTPGHVDFTYEVSRSLSACQGVVLLVDANQGVEAQTVANFYLAFTQDLAIIPVINKIDLHNADPEAVTEQMMKLFDTDPEDVLKVSAKYGTGVTNVLKAVVDKIPSPAKSCRKDAPLRALLFDSWYDKIKGVVCQVLVVDGKLKVGDRIQSFHTGKSYEIKTVAFLAPNEVPTEVVYTGQVGIFTANIRNTSEARIGDTFHIKNQKVDPLPGFKEAKPMVFAGIYPIDSGDRLSLKAAIEKLALNDSSVKISEESSEALGHGWRIGFLGLLHMEVFSTRLEQEFGAQVVVTTPSVPYKVRLMDTAAKRKFKEELERTINNPSLWPEDHIMETFEPMVKATIISPEEYITAIMKLCDESRGLQMNSVSLTRNRIVLTYKLPLNEIIVDFFDQLKSVSSGYATFDYEEIGYEASKLVKLKFKLNAMEVEELSVIVPEELSMIKGRRICLKLKETLPRQLFQIAIQACIGKKVIARENIKAVRKDVLAKCYGGDVTRKMKLLKRQAEGKKKMKLIGNIEIPRETFIEVLKK